MTVWWAGRLPSEPSEAIRVAAHTWGQCAAAARTLCYHLIPGRSSVLLATLTRGCSLAQEGFRPSEPLERVTSIEPETHVRH